MKESDSCSSKWMRFLKRMQSSYKRGQPPRIELGNQSSRGLIFTIWLLNPPSEKDCGLHAVRWEVSSREDRQERWTRKRLFRIFACKVSVVLCWKFDKKIQKKEMMRKDQSILTDLQTLRILLIANEQGGLRM